jgi:hypothetical protein
VADGALEDRRDELGHGVGEKGHINDYEDHENQLNLREFHLLTKTAVFLLALE